MAIIRFLAQDSRRVIFGEHAQERIDERSVNDNEVREVLRLGEPRGPVEPGIRNGEWKVKVVGRPRGSRELGVVTIILVNDHLFLKTIEWEDK